GQGCRGYTCRLFALRLSENPAVSMAANKASRERPPDEVRPSERRDKRPERLPTEPMKTFSAKAAEVTHEWYVIDATDKVLGRVASEVALRLRGKHKAIYTPHVATGDFIVIVNAEKLRVTGNKAEDKVYYRHSGYPGGIRGVKF